MIVLAVGIMATQLVVENVQTYLILQRNHSVLQKQRQEYRKITETLRGLTEDLLVLSKKNVLAEQIVKEFGISKVDRSQ